MLVTFLFTSILEIAFLVLRLETLLEMESQSKCWFMVFLQIYGICIESIFPHGMIFELSENRWGSLFTNETYNSIFQQLQHTTMYA